MFEFDCFLKTLSLKIDIYLFSICAAAVVQFDS